MASLGFGWPGSADARYDRRVDSEFLDLFREGHGLFRSLPEYANGARYPVDLQFRRDIRTGAQRATVYVGMQNALDVHWRDGEVRLTGHARLGRRSGFEEVWSNWTSLEDAGALIDDVEGYLETVVPRVAATAVEGAVQSAASSFGRDGTAVIDREFALQFRNRQVRQRLLQSWTDDIVALLIEAPVLRDSPPHFGDRCDLVGISKRGELLAIEVKPRSVESIVWAPAQAIVYARMLQYWLTEDPAAPEILNQIAAARAELGLLTSRPPLIGLASRVRPVIAIQRGTRPDILADMDRVIAYLRSAGIEEANALEVRGVSMSGRLVRDVSSGWR